MSICKDYTTIERPVVSEKTMIAMENNNQYVFVVHKASTKPQIKRAVEKVFGVKVSKVNTVNTTGKTKRTRNITGKRSNIKKAYVTLQPGETIELVAGAE